MWLGDRNADFKRSTRFAEIIENFICELDKYKLAAVAQWLRASIIFESQHLSDTGSSPAGSICRDLNSQKLHY